LEKTQKEEKETRETFEGFVVELHDCGKHT
jgi:hypothetical protein